MCSLILLHERRGRFELMRTSTESFDLVQFQNGTPWRFVPDEKVRLPGAHGSEIVRSFCFLDLVC